MKTVVASLVVLLSTALVAAEVYANAEGFIQCKASAVIKPNSTAQVQEIVQNAMVSGQTVKAAGAGHSTNYIICAKDNGLILAMENMNQIVSHDAESLQVTVQGGAGLVQFFQDMVPLGMTIEGMVDYGAITVAGAIATGAHSSSLKVHSGVADHIVAVTLVTGMGEVVRLTSDDPDFCAIHTNLGALGIITEVTFQAVPLFKVRGQQINLSSRIDTLPNDLVGLVQDHDYANLYWFLGNNNAILHTYNKVDAATPGNGHRTTWDPTFASFVPWVYYKAIEALNNVFSENEMCLLAKTRALQLANSETTEDVGYPGAMYMGTVCHGNKCLFPQVDDVEISIPLESVSAALRDIKAITVCFPVFGLYVRFGLQSKTLLGPTRNSAVAYIEMHILRTRNGTPHLGFAAIDEVRQLLLNKYNGNPHYGKNFAVDFVGRSNPEFDAIATKYDPKGIFQNPFLALRNTNSTTMAAQCAHERTCICADDSHCYPGWKCSTGTVYKEARVCKKGSGLHCERNDECGSSKCVLFKCA
ncbi:hypothetical protein HDU91_006790 [Kappamyces sp. JEL0680]|nr:hypothetical protein HDU91_006790 [Kappamyces sp. JEL0680]